MTTVSPEQELLGSLTLHLEQPTDRQRQLVQTLDGVEGLLRAARREGSSGMLYVNLKRAGLLASLPPQARNHLEARYHRNGAMNLRLETALRALGGDLEAGGVPVVVIKGMALLDSLYDNPGMRATGDIDLWIAPQRRTALDVALKARAYRQERFYPDTYRRGATVIDVHTHPLTTDRIRARAEILARGQAPLLEGRLPTAYGATITRLAEAPEIFLLVLHFMKHNADRLAWLIEINELVARLDADQWCALLELSDRMHQRRSLRRVGYLAGELLPLTVTARLREVSAAPALPRFERRALDRRVTRGSLPAWGPLWFFSVQRGMRARAVSILETLFPRPAVLRQVFNDAEASAWRLYMRRLGQLVSLALR